MKLLKLWEKIGKQPLKSTKNLEAIVETESGKYIITKINYQSGKLVSLQAEKIGCKTCKNYPKYNNGYAPPHTCDICTSLDQEDDYEMWEAK